MEDEVPVVVLFRRRSLTRRYRRRARYLPAGNSRARTRCAPAILTVVVLDSAAARCIQNILEHTGQGLTEGLRGNDRPDVHPGSRSSCPGERGHDAPATAAVVGCGAGRGRRGRQQIRTASRIPDQRRTALAFSVLFRENRVRGSHRRNGPGKDCRRGSGQYRSDGNGITGFDACACAGGTKALCKQLHAGGVSASNSDKWRKQSRASPPNPDKQPSTGPRSPRTYRDPLSGQNDFAGYRVYRSTYFTIGPWTLVADIKKDSACPRGRQGAVSSTEG